MNRIVSASLFLVMSGNAWSQVTETKILPSDGGAGDFFGVCVAASAGVAIVGASYHDDVSGPNDGAAYLFDMTSGAQLAELRANDAQPEDYFGFDVAIDGNFAIVSAIWDDDNGLDSGSAYIFDVATGAQLTKLIANDGSADDGFGNAVAISGDLAVVTASKDDDNGPESGSAYVFDIHSGNQIAKLLPSDGETQDYFGYNAVAISGNTVAVGCFEDTLLGVSSGTVYVFDATTGVQLTTYHGSDQGAGAAFGYSLAMSGTKMIVGAFGDGQSGNFAGAAYLFDTSTGVELAKLMASDGSPMDAFGFTVGISGNTAIVGAEGDRDNGEWSGSAYFFNVATGVEFAKVVPSDGSANDRYGRDVAIAGRQAVVGALYDDDNGTDSGSVYLHDLVLHVDNTGSAFCFGDGTGGLCPCGNFGLQGEGCSNSTGNGGAKLTGSGDAALGGDTFQLAIEGAPPGTPGLLLSGINQLSGGSGTPFGQGLLCTSGQVQRSQVQLVSATGSTLFDTFAGGPFGASSYGVGVTANYQFWYRDPQSGCSLLDYNLSNAWAVIWQP